MNVGFDMDSTLVDFWGGVFLHYEMIYGVKMSVEDVKDHSIERSFPPDVAENITNIMHAPNFFFGLQPYPEAVEVVDALLDRGHEVDIVTSPVLISKPGFPRKVISHVCVVEKLMWVQRHLPKLTNSVYFAKKKWKWKGDMLVDDAPYQFEPWYEETGEFVFVPAHPWNDVEMPHSEHCKRGHIREIPEFVDKIANLMRNRGAHD